MQWWQYGIILLSGFLILSFGIFLILNKLKHKSYNTTINGTTVKIKVGDIFCEQGLNIQLV